MNTNTPAASSPPAGTPNRPYDYILTLAVPKALEEEVIDFLLFHPEWIKGFSYTEAQGMGSGAGLRSAMEKVKGRARRILVTTLLRSEHFDPLIQAMKKQFQSPEIAYWVAPLIAFDRLI